MPCKHFQEALVEAAATGAEPQGELQSHLAACVLCRASLAEERSLFSSLDTGLRVAANSEVPASLLPRVRARIAEETTATRSWATTWFALAGAAAMVVALFAARAIWRTNVVQKPVETAGKTSVPPRVTPPPQSQNPVVVPPVEKNSVSQRQRTIAMNPLAPETLVSGKAVPEVLVPRDQEILLTEYAAQWRLHTRAPILAQDSQATILALLQVTPIQIDQLDVKLLAEEHAQ